MSVPAYYYGGWPWGLGTVPYGPFWPAPIDYCACARCPCCGKPIRPVASTPYVPPDITWDGTGTAPNVTSAGNDIDATCAGNHAK